MSTQVDAEEIARQAVALAKREIERLTAQKQLSSWDASDLERYFKIVQRYEETRLDWLRRLDPTSFDAEMLEKLKRITNEL